ncbi:MAG TPA: hypothetical protein VLI69_00330 [Gammaproteobacteria bacterium]|nr:hypothetical protein [Gammaproteobacteria bacterium]
MKVNSSTMVSVTFSDIFTEEDPPAQKNLPPKKPYIIFKAPYIEGVMKPMRLEGLSRFGEISVEYSPETKKAVSVVLTISGDRKVTKAIEIFLNRNEYANSENNILRAKLLSYQKRCETKWKAKSKKLPPVKSNLFSDYKEDKSEKKTSQSSNLTYPVEKKGKKYIYKEVASGRSVGEVEVFNGFCYRLLLGDRHPKVKAVHGEGGERKGLLSKKLEGFESIYDRFNAFKKTKDAAYKPTINDLIDAGVIPTEQELLESEMAKVWVASFTERENDAHAGNYGFAIVNGKKVAVKIDDDQSEVGLTSQFFEVNPRKKLPLIGYKVAPVDTFPVTERDVINFPYLQDAKPKNWPTNLSMGTELAQNDLIQAHRVFKQQKFIDDKYYMFLKRILIPNEMYENLAEVTMRSPKKRKLFAESKIARTEELKKVLLSMPEFHSYIARHPEAIQQIKSEFVEYNASFKDKDIKLRVNIEQIMSHYKAVVDTVIPKPSPVAGRASNFNNF